MKARPTWTPPLSPSHPRSRRTRLFDEAVSPDSPRSTGDGDSDHLSVFPYLESEKKKFLMAAASNKVKEYSVRREHLSQALNCGCTSELNTGAFTIKLIVNAQVFSSDVQKQFSS